MFEKYMIVEDTLRNVRVDGRAAAYEVGVRMPYYRGLGLSMVEDVSVVVDGVVSDPAATAFTVHGNRYPLAGLGEVPEDRWELGEVAAVEVSRPGGLASGVHDVQVSVRLRISYMPVPGGGTARAELTLLD